VGQHGEQRKAAAEVLVDHVGAPYLVRAAFAQAQQAGGVVDLAVQQDDGANAGVAQATVGLHRREVVQLRADVRRGIAQHPVHAVVGERDGRLGTCPGIQAAVAKARAVGAVAIPLGKATAGGGAENLHVHGKPVERIRRRVRNENAPANRGAVSLPGINGLRSTW
jgi:hypothetical protein